MNQLNDISLVAQVVVFRNTKAFDQLVKKYQSPVRRFFLNLTCGDSELSDDLAQDTFIKAYTNIASFRNLSSFSTWLYRIAYNIFYDYIRSRKETADLDAREIDAANSAEQENIGQKMDIYRSLKTLKEIERTCITLFYMEDLSIEKIAGITGIPTGTVKSHLSRGKEKLATYLKQNGYDKIENDEKLLKDFFTANKQEIADNGFSRRVMHRLPDRSNWLARIWNAAVVVAGAVLFIWMGGLEAAWGTIREVFISMINQGTAELDPKSIIIASVVLVFMATRKVASMA